MVSKLSLTVCHAFKLSLHNLHIYFLIYLFVNPKELFAINCLSPSVGVEGVEMHMRRVLKKYDIHVESKFYKFTFLGKLVVQDSYALGKKYYINYFTYFDINTKPLSLLRE